MSSDDLKRHNCKTDPEVDYFWMEVDGKGIPLCRVCDKCRSAKLSKYRPEILEPYTQADVDEPIEPEEYYGMERDW